MSLGREFNSRVVALKERMEGAMYTGRRANKEGP